MTTKNLYLYELEWVDACNACPRNVIDCRNISSNGEILGFRILAKSMQKVPTHKVKELYEFLRKNGNLPYMTQTKSGAFRIHYFNKPNNKPNK